MSSGPTVTVRGSENGTTLTTMQSKLPTHVPVREEQPIDDLLRRILLFFQILESQSRIVYRIFAILICLLVLVGV